MIVKLYSQLECWSCQRAKGFLKSKKINFREYDVSVSEQARAKMIMKSGQEQVPVIDIGGILLVGFNEKAVKMALGHSK